MDGPVILYRVSMPHRHGDRQALLRVLSSTSEYLCVRVTALPGDVPLARRTWNVLKSDLALMCSTGLAQRITTHACPSCTGVMSVYHAAVNRRATVMLRCALCVECHEI